MNYRNLTRLVLVSVFIWLSASIPAEGRETWGYRRGGYVARCGDWIWVAPSIYVREVEVNLKFYYFQTAIKEMDYEVSRYNERSWFSKSWVLDIPEWNPCSGGEIRYDYSLEKTSGKKTGISWHRWRDYGNAGDGKVHAEIWAEAGKTVSCRCRIRAYGQSKSQGDTFVEPPETLIVSQGSIIEKKTYYAVVRTYVLEYKIFGTPRNYYPYDPTELAIFFYAKGADRPILEQPPTPVNMKYIPVAGTKAERHSVISIVVNGVEVTSTKARSDGSFVADRVFVFEGQNRITARCKGESGVLSAESDPVCVFCDTFGPPRPRLISPPIGSATNNLRPLFDWDDAVDAGIGLSDYEIEVDRNYDFVTPLIKAVASESQFAPEDDLTEGWYYWRIRAEDKLSNLGEWSQTFYFLLETIPPPPVITLVANSKPNGDIELRWDAVEDGESGTNYYKVFRSEIEGLLGEQINIDGMTIGTSYTDYSRNLEDETRYFYTIQPVDAAGNICALGNNQSSAACRKPGLADSPSPMFHCNSEHTGTSKYAGPSHPEVKWSKPIWVRSLLPAIGPGGTIYLVGREAGVVTNDRLYAIKLSGEVKWDFDCREVCEDSPAIDKKGRVFVTGHPYGSSNYQLYCVSGENGSELWRYYIGTAGGSPAIGRDGTIYTGGGDTFYAIRPDGSLKWSYELAGAGAFSFPAVSDGFVFTGTSNGIIYCFDEDGFEDGNQGWQEEVSVGDLDGDVIWQYDTGDVWLKEPVVFASEEIGVHVAGNNFFHHILFDPEYLTIQSFQNSDFGVYDMAPCCHGDGYIYGVGPYGVYRLNRAGSGSYIYPPDGIRIQARPAATIGRDGTLYVCGAVQFEGHFYALNLQPYPSSPTLKWELIFDTPAAPKCAPVIGYDGTIYIADENYLYAIGNEENVVTSPDGMVEFITEAEGVTLREISPQSSEGIIALNVARGSGLTQVSNIYELLPAGISGSFVFKYDPVEVDTAGLGLYRFDIESMSWVLVSTDIDSENHLISADIPSVSSCFGLFSISDPVRPEVSNIAIVPNYISPNEDGINDRAWISYSVMDNIIQPSTRVTVQIFDCLGQLVRSVITNQPQPIGRNTVFWDGKDNSGKIVYEGAYMSKVTCKDAAGNESLPCTETIFVDFTPPKVHMKIGQPHYEKEGLTYINSATEINLFGEDPEVENVIFLDDFEKDIADWQPEVGTWVLEDGKYRGTNGKSKTLSTFPGDRRVRARVKTPYPGGNTWEVGWVYAKYTDWQNCLYALLHLNGDIELTMLHEGIRSRYGAFSDLTPLDWHEFRFDISGNTVELFIDDTKYLGVIDEKVSKLTGGVAFDANTCTAWFEDVTVIYGTNLCSGVDRIEVSVDDGSFLPYMSSISLFTEGRHALRYRAVDNVGIWGEEKVTILFVDNRPPETTLTPSMPLYSDGVNNYASPEYSYFLDALDPGTQLIIFFDDFRLGTANWITESGNWNLEDEKYRGEKGKSKSKQSFPKDRIVEAMVKTTDAGLNRWEVGWVYAKYIDWRNTIYALIHTGGMIELTVVYDGVSERYECYSILDPTNWHRYRFDIIEDNLKLRIDGIEYFDITSDKISKIAGSVGLEAHNSKVLFDDVSVTVSGEEACSGLSRIEFDLDNEGFLTYAGPISLATQGRHVLTYRAIDNLGNREEDKEFVVIVDTSPPVTTLTPSAELYVSDGNNYALLDYTYSLKAYDPEIGEVSFLDDFSQQPDKWIVESGHWEIQDGEYSGDHGKSSSSEALTCDRVVEAKMRTVVPGENSWDVAWFYAKYVDWNNCVYALLHKTGDIEINVIAGGSKSRYDAESELSPLNWHTYRFELIGDHLKFSIDRTQYLDIVDEKISQVAGALALEAFASSILVDEVKVLSEAHPGSGVQSIQVNVDNQGFEIYNGTISFSTHGKHTIDYYSTDNVENKEETTLFVVYIDSTPPVTTIEISEPVFVKEGITYLTSKSSVTLSAIDPVVGSVASGVAITMYRVDESTWTEYTAAIHLEKGIHVIEYYSVDKAENREEISTFTGYVDNTPPVTTLTVAGSKYEKDEITYVTSTSTFTLSAKDPEQEGVASGVLFTYYCVDSSSWTLFIEGFTVLEGTHTIEYYSLDNLRNEEEIKMLTVYVDDTAPESTFYVSEPKYISPDGKQTFVTPHTQLSIDAEDPEVKGVSSGVREILFSIDKAGYQEYRQLFTLLEGAHTIQWYAVDNVGNTEEIHTLTVLVDSTPPVTTLTSSGELYVSDGRNYAPIYYTYSLDAFDPEMGENLFLEDFSVSFDNWIVDSGEWKIQDGKYLGSHGKTRFSEALTCDRIVEAKMKTVVPGENSWEVGWFYAKYVDWNNCIYVLLHKTSEIEINVIAGGSKSRYDVESKLSPLDWHTYRFELIGDHLKFSIDRTQYLDIVDEKLSEIGGSLAFEASNSSILVDDVKVLEELHPGSGVKEILFSIDGAGYQEYTLAITLSEGVHTIRWYAVDNVANTEDMHTFIVSVDATPPQSILTLQDGVQYRTPDGTLYASSDTQYLLAAEDPEIRGVTSGVWRILVAIDKEEYCEYTGAITLSEGEHTIQWYAVDNVGNTENVHTFTVSVDTTPPETELVIGEPSFDGFGYKFISPQTPLTLSAEDPVSNNVSSGLKITEYRLNAGDWTVYTGTFSFPSGQYLLEYRSRDNVENTEETKKVQLAVTVLEEYAVFAPTKVKINGNGIVKGDTCSNTLIHLVGNAVVDGNVTAEEIKVKGNAEINGEIREECLSLPEEPLDVEILSLLVQESNDNEKIPLTQLGREPVNQDGILTLEDNDVLVLSTGTYYLTGLDISDNATLKTEGPVGILIDGVMEITGKGNLTSSGVPWNSFVISSTDTVVKVSGQGKYEGLIYAPHAKVQVSGNGMVMTGNIFAREAHIAGQAQVISPERESRLPVRSALAHTPKNSPDPDSDFYLRAYYIYPNPAKRGVSPIIHLECGIADRLEIRIYNIAGELVHDKTITGIPFIKSDKYVYEHSWDIGDIASGIYISVIDAHKQGENPIRQIKKLAVIK